MQHLLFSYGTLQLPSVQLSSFGRLLTGKPDRLLGYKLAQLKITDETVLAKSETATHPIAIKTNNPIDFIEGVIFEISEKELQQADEYEVEDYCRVQELFESGALAWVYVEANQ